MVKKSVLLCMVLILMSFNVSAQEEELQRGFDRTSTIEWLKENSHSNLNLEDLSFTITALSKSGEDVSELMASLNEQKHEDLGCFPSPRCNTKHTSAAMLAMSTAGNDISQQIEWLKESVTSFGGGQWRIQIEGSGDGQCSVEYPVGLGEQTQEKRFTMRGNEIEEAQGRYFIDISRDLNPGIVNARTGAIIKVDCTQLQTAIISLIYTSGNDIYILQERNGRGEFLVHNGCFAASNLGGRCDYESSVYAAWAIKETSGNQKLDEYGVKTYLSSETRNDDLYRAMLARTFGERLYLNELGKSQAADGSWGNRNVFTTAMAVFALQGFSEEDSFSRGKEFLENTVSINGAWFEKVKDTSMALIALTGGDFVQGPAVPRQDSQRATSDNEICDNLLDDDGDSYFDCGDMDCSSFEACTCQNKRLDQGEENVDCGGVCENLCDEEKISVTPDFPEQPQASEDDFPSRPVLDEEESSWRWLWWVIGILAVLGSGVFFFIKYRSGELKKKPKTQFEQYTRQVSQRPVQRPQQRPVLRRSALRSKEEDDLDKSLKDAEKLLKGK